MIFAAVDVGSNTLRLLVADVSPSGVHPLRYERVITRLAGGIKETGLLGEAASEKSLAALKDFAGIIEQFGVERTWCVGTSALREARNAPEFMEKARGKTGLEVEIVSGEKEARLTAMGVLSSVERPSRFVIVDIGGGSTEFIFSTEASGLDHFTVPVGVVKMAEAHMCSDPPSAEELISMRAEAERIAETLRERVLWDRKGGAALIGTAGTANTLAAIDLGLERFDPRKVHNHRLSLGRLREMFSLLSALPTAKRAGIKGLEPGREDLIIPGIILTISFMEVLRFREILVSSAGLLEGIVLELYERTRGK